MRVLVVTSDVPFVEGGHRVIARALVRALRDGGHEAELLTTPQNRFGRQLSAYLATWLTDVQVSGDGRQVDRVISLRFPSYAVRHPRHVVWLNHRMREYYDLWQQFRAGLGWRGRLVQPWRRAVLRALDRRLLGRCHYLFAQSQTIRDRLQRWGGHDAEVLYPPPPPRAYARGAPDGSILAVARLQPLKRLDLLIRAAAGVPGLSVRIIGEGPERAELQQLAEQLGVTDRVRLLGHRPERELLEAYAHCSAVYYGARAEDYGLVTFEAFASGKPVITCTDSGGPAELVQPGQTGWVVPPEPEALAGVMREASRPEVSVQLGEAALALARRHTWQAVIERLVRA